MTNSTDNLKQSKINTPNISQGHNLYSKAPKISALTSNKKLPFIALGVVLLLIIAYFVAAYFTGFWPFAPTKKSSEELFSQVFEKLNQIETASYEVVFSLETTEREVGIEPLEVEYSEVEDARYERDSQRFWDLRDLRTKLELAYAELGQFPNALEEGNIYLKDPSGPEYSYQATKGGEGFQITITFETQEAIEEIRTRNYSDSSYYSEPIIDGQTVTFSEDIQGKHIAYYYFSSQPRRPFFVSFVENQAEYLSFIPSNFKGSFNLAGMIKKESENSANNRFSFGAKVEYEDMMLELATDLVKIDEVLYFRINKIPGLLLMFLAEGDISAIKEKWIKIMPDELLKDYSLLSMLEPFSSAERSQEKSKQLMEQLQLFFEIAQQESLFLGSDKAKREEFDGKRVFHYQLGLNPDNIIDFYKKATEAFKEKFGDEAILKFKEVTLRYLQAPETREVINYFNQNGQFDLLVERKTGYPVKLNYQFKFVPESSVRNLQDKQIILSAGLKLNSINKEIKIEAPKGFIPYDEAMMLMSGMTKEEYLFQKQISNIDALSRALKTFYGFTGTYPKRLEELKLTGSQAEEQYGKSKTQAGYYSSYYEEIPFLERIPKDVYTDGDYQYEKVSSDDYQLKYKIELPEYEQGYTVSYNYYLRDYSDEIGGVDKMSLRYVEGINTADSLVSSKEARNLQNIDSDQDALSNSFEEYLGTDSHKKDTDGDGDGDGYELQRGSNPLGSGRLKSKSGYLY